MTFLCLDLLGEEGRFEKIKAEGLLWILYILQLCEIFEVFF